VKRLFNSSAVALAVCFNTYAYAYPLVSVTTGGTGSCGYSNPGEVMYIKNNSIQFIDVTYEVVSDIGGYKSANTVRLQPLQLYSTSTCSVTQYGTMQTIIRSETIAS
jgi:hypothetical protein